LVAIAFVAASSSRHLKKVTLVLRLFEFVHNTKKAGQSLAESLVETLLSSLELISLNIYTIKYESFPTISALAKCHIHLNPLLSLV